MKTKLITLFVLAASIISYAQEFSGKAIYKTSRKSNFKIGNDSKMTDQQKEELMQRFQKMNQKTYILKFDKYTSTYKQDVKLKAPKPQAGNQRLVVMSFGGSGDGSVYYKNVKENRYANQTEIMSKRFLVKDSLPIYKWEMSSETKNIGNYTCYKASFTEEVENIKMSFINGESKEEKETKVVTTTAWYTPQIPVSNGPKDYQGLPGLILEINDGTTTMVCTEIVLNPSETLKINEPEKGKVVNQEEFDKISRQKSKEMMERFKSRNGVDLGNGVNIKMGG